jgi:hypothetical protein
MINQDFGWQATGWLTRVPTSLGTSWRQLVPKLVPKLVEILVSRRQLGACWSPSWLKPWSANQLLANQSLG